MLLKRHERNSKYEPLIEKVELLNCNPQYAQVRFDSGRESTVSLRDLAPFTLDLTQNQTNSDNDESLSEENTETLDNTTTVEPDASPEVRRSGRACKPPERLGFT